jgi:hypothetical protein
MLSALCLRAFNTSLSSGRAKEEEEKKEHT